MTIRFFYNGIKGANGQLQKCAFYYADSPKYPTGTVIIRKKDYVHFTQDVAEAFEVTNDSDYITDYFENDKIRVVPSHPLYQQVKEACDKAQARYEAQCAKRRAKWDSV